PGQRAPRRLKTPARGSALARELRSRPRSLPLPAAGLSPRGSALAREGHSLPGLLPLPAARLSPRGSALAREGHSRPGSLPLPAAGLSPRGSALAREGHSRPGRSCTRPPTFAWWERACAREAFATGVAPTAILGPGHNISG